MGFFDRFKKKDNDSIQPAGPIMQRQPQEPFTLKSTYLPDGSTQYEFHDNIYNVGQLYDTTRLIVQSQSVLAGKVVYNCLISWYGETDCQYLGSDGQSIGRVNDYKSITVELDLRALQNNPEYIQTVMKGLLNENRVTSYLNKGLNNTAQCGNYVGGVYRKESGVYAKYFDTHVGIASHNSPAMVQERTGFQESQRRSRQEQIARKRAEIERLNADIEDLSR